MKFKLGFFSGIVSTVIATILTGLAVEYGRTQERLENENRKTATLN